MELFKVFLTAIIMASYSMLGVFSLYPTKANREGPAIPDSLQPPVHEHNSSAEFSNPTLHVENLQSYNRI